MLHITRLSNDRFVTKGSIFGSFSEAFSYLKEYYNNEPIFLKKADALTDAFWIEVDKNRREYWRSAGCRG